MSSREEHKNTSVLGNGGKITLVDMGQDSHGHMSLESVAFVQLNLVSGESLGTQLTHLQGCGRPLKCKLCR